MWALVVVGVNAAVYKNAMVDFALLPTATPRLPAKVRDKDLFHAFVIIYLLEQ